MKKVSELDKRRLTINNTITEELLSDCIYSMNKRAKNYRNKKQHYKNRKYTAECKYHKYRDYLKKEKFYYDAKHTMLSIFQPKCIHKQITEVKDKNYITLESEDFEIVEQQYRLYQTNSTNKEFCYYTKKNRELHFLYYTVGNRGFHIPIIDINNQNLEIIDIDENFYTKGNKVDDLVNVDFCLDVLKLINKKKLRIGGSHEK